MENVGSALFKSIILIRPRIINFYGGFFHSDISNFILAVCLLQSHLLLC